MLETDGVREWMARRVRGCGYSNTSYATGVDPPPLSAIDARSIVVHLRSSYHTFTLQDHLIPTKSAPYNAKQPTSMAPEPPRMVDDKQAAPETDGKAKPDGQGQDCRLASPRSGV